MEKVNVWRLQTKTDNATDYKVSEYCLDNHVLAMGRSLNDKHLEGIENREDCIDERQLISSENEEESFRKYTDFVVKNKVYNNIKNVQRLKNIKPNDLVWMRVDGIYYLGLVGEESVYLYNSSEEALKMDASNQKTGIKWFKIGGEADVAGVIATSFIKGHTLQKINQIGALEFSQKLINDLYKEIDGIKSIENSSEVLFNLISPDDCEDIVCMRLYKEYGYIVIPSTCKKSTPLYECVLIDPKNTKDKEVYVQVKKGTVNIDPDDYTHLNGEVWLFTTKGKVKEHSIENIHIIDPETIYEFAMNSENDNVLPTKIIKWRELLMNK